MGATVILMLFVGVWIYIAYSG